MAESKNPGPEATGQLVANAPQMALLNGMLPRGFRFELAENVSFKPKTGKRTKVVSPSNPHS